MTTQCCIDCVQTKPISDFYPTKSGTPQRRCKPCSNRWNAETRRRKKAERAMARLEGFSPSLQSWCVRPAVRA
jgi:hypothetical protein